MKILVIESDRAVAQALVQALARHHVPFEDNPDAAIANILSAADAGDPYDLVFCGFAQPGGAGYRLLAALRALREPPVCTLISSYSDVVEAAMFADFVLLKPVSRADLEDVVGRVQSLRSTATTRRIRTTRAAS